MLGSGGDTAMHSLGGEGSLNPERLPAWTENVRPGRSAAIASVTTKLARVVVTD
jgi:hypothetical protein